MTAPTVIYQCRRTNGVLEEVSNPSALPDVAVRESISEPFVKMEVITPTEYNGQLMELCQQRRGARCPCAARSLLITDCCATIMLAPAQQTARLRSVAGGAVRAAPRFLRSGCWCVREYTFASPLQPQHCVPYSS